MIFNYKHVVTSSKGFPTEKHLAIIEFGSMYIPGDERSRTHPGHGYPESTVTTVSYSWYALEDREHWIKHIETLMGIGQYSSKKDFIALDSGVMVTPQLKVTI